MTTQAPAGSFRLRGVSVDFDGTRVVDDVSFAIDPGERVTVVGPSGAGKTTLLRLMNGTVFPTEGSVEVGGMDLASLAPRALRAVRAKIGFVHQDHCLVPNLRVSQNVAAGKLGQRGFLAASRAMIAPPRSEVEEIHALLERVGIAEKLFQRTDRLSGGQQQRVAIARALFQEPTALLADEPVASVDPARARDVIALLLELAHERELTLVACMHDLELAREFFPRTIGLRQGRVQFDAPTADVAESAFRELYRLED
jgi:phosphonate transport system ATP-binding protein